jgi:hypothetical protein
VSAGRHPFDVAVVLLLGISCLPAPTSVRAGAWLMVQLVVFLVARPHELPRATAVRSHTPEL